MALQLGSKWRIPQNPRLVHLFSSSSSSSSIPNGGEYKMESPPSPSPPSYSSYFSDVKASLKQSTPPRRVSSLQSNEPTPFASPKPSKVTSLDEIRKNLSEFRRQSSVPLRDEKSPSPRSQPISFQELYKRNVIEKSGEGNTGTVETNKSGKLSFDPIRENLRQFRSSTGNQTSNDRFRGSADRGSRVLDPMSLQTFKESLKLRPGDSSTSSPIVLGGSDSLPPSVFGKELREKKEMESQTMKTDFVKMYSYNELGEKLRKLRPSETKGDKNWFSLGELNERLMKLREIEEKETESRIGGVSFKDLRESLVRLRMSEDDKAKRSTIQRLDLLGQLGGTPNFMLGTPKDNLVEKYFHPDNMSSAEKLKLELQKVRDEFKMSESDCGSTRVQVAQLTTKIKHLSSHLHKKDKHSRKGLKAMVEQRKKLLKYLRRTDWDSYTLVLSKLGLRDNPIRRQ